MLYKRRLRLKVYLPEEDPSVPTVTTIWPGANWMEREAADLMGVDFVGHPDKRRLMMPDDWQGHPHRRDYPLGYETVMFSFNSEEIAKHKPKATE
jgi:NADH-quinone oxidoreductase subunit C